MNVAILGATKGMGRALARLLAERGDRLCVMGRDREDVERTAADLRARGKGPVTTAPCDLDDPTSFGPALDAAWRDHGRIDCVIVTAGRFATQAALEADRELTRKILVGNFAHTVILCEEARERLLAQGGGTLCVFSSVAGDRGRKPVAIYGAAKAGLSTYLEALDHRFHDRGLRVVAVKPGFVKTAAMEGLPVPPFAGEPEAVARRVLGAMDRGTPLVYAPGIWRWIMLVIRHLPRFVMRRVGF
jgi:NAD(P)-dependent dehydrogenase (short-subunit alcohol dehydrogenase family)